METIGMRIRHERELQGIDRKELSKKAGIGYSTLAELERGGMKTTTKLHWIAEALGVSQGWLETGMGTKKAIPHEITTAEAPKAGYLRFELLDFSASAGDGEANPEFPEVINFVDIAEWSVYALLGFTPSGSRVKLITVRGDSMLPNIKNGDVAFVDTAHNFYNRDALYLIGYDGCAFVKRLQRLPDGLHIISDNKDFLSYTMPRDEIHGLNVIGRVVAVMTLKKT